MAKTGTKVCKICGCEYPYCKTYTPTSKFRYQDVACCAEHGEEYLALIIKSRTATQEAEGVKKTKNKKSKPTAVVEITEKSVEKTKPVMADTESAE